MLAASVEAAGAIPHTTHAGPRPLGTTAFVPEPRSESYVFDESRQAPQVIVAASAAALGTALTVAALFPGYYSDGKSLAGSAEVLWFNLPTIFAWAAASLLLIPVRTRSFAIGLLVAATVVDAAYFISDISSVIAGDNTPSAGFALGVAGFLACVVGCVAAGLTVARSRDRGLASGVGPALWATFGAVAAGVWALGEALPAYSWHYRLVHGTWNATGTANWTRTCCSPWHNAPGYDVAQTVALMVVAVLLAVAAAVSKPRVVGVGVLLGAGLGLACEWTSAAAYLVTANVDPLRLGFTQTQVNDGGLSIAIHPAIGFWLLAAGVASLLLILVARVASGGAVERQRT